MPIITAAHRIFERTAGGIDRVLQAAAGVTDWALNVWFLISIRRNCRLRRLLVGPRQHNATSRARTGRHVARVAVRTAVHLVRAAHGLWERAAGVGARCCQTACTAIGTRLSTAWAHDVANGSGRRRRRGGPRHRLNTITYARLLVEITFVALLTAMSFVRAANGFFKRAAAGTSRPIHAAGAVTGTDSLAATRVVDDDGLRAYCGAPRQRKCPFLARHRLQVAPETVRTTVSPVRAADRIRVRATAVRRI